MKIDFLSLDFKQSQKVQQQQSIVSWAIGDGGATNNNNTSDFWAFCGGIEWKKYTPCLGSVERMFQMYVCWNSYYYNGGTTRTTTTTRTTNWWFVLSVIYQIPAFLPKRSSATTTMAHTLTHFSVRFPALDVVCVLSLCVYFDKFFVCISILADLKEVTLYLKIRPLHTEFKIHKKRKIEE